MSELTRLSPEQRKWNELCFEYERATGIPLIKEECLNALLFLEKNGDLGKRKYCFQVFRLFYNLDETHPGFHTHKQIAKILSTSVDYSGKLLDDVRRRLKWYRDPQRNRNLEAIPPQ